MTIFSLLGFASPGILIALVSLPVIWILLRVTPPSPTRIPFPPLVIIRRWMREESAPARIPLWILILRLLIAAALILAMAGPHYAPNKSLIEGKGPLAIYVETGWPAAVHWDLRQKILSTLIKEAERAERPILLIASGSGPGQADLMSPNAALDKLRSLAPLTYRPERKDAIESLNSAIRPFADAELVIAFDGLTSDDDQNALALLNTLAEKHKALVLQHDASHLVALSGATNSRDGLNLRVIRSMSSSQDEGRLTAYDSKGRSLGETPYRFSESQTVTEALITLPIDLRNEIVRVTIAGSKTSGAVQLMDDSQKRRRIGLVSGTSPDIAQALLTPDYYLARALEPHADLREPRQGIVGSISTLLDENTSIIILADIGALPPDIETRLRAYIDQGGILIRFAGPQLASGTTTLLPVRLRGNGRALGGSLSWETPQRLSEFMRESPFYGLPIPDDVTVTRQLLAEPDTDLSKKTWAALTDGTPVVTGESRGKGYLILFHVTADIAWSNLPLSGLYLAMFERILRFAKSEHITNSTTETEQALQPYRSLDGFGEFITPPPTAKPVLASKAIQASSDHPAGLYGDVAAPFAVNSLTETSTIKILDQNLVAGKIIPLEEPQRVELAPLLMIFAALLMALDGFVTLIRGRGHRIRSFMRIGALFAFALVPFMIGIQDGHAASSDIAPKDQDAALKTRLGYVITGDATTDEISRIGLESLSRILGERTSFEPAEPVGIDLKSDDLAVYPLLYWPMTADQQMPTQDATRRIDRFMKNGGTILFDTRDASLTREDDPTPETERLRLILAGLSLPPLEPLPADHVLTKAFYLIDRIVGRTINGQTWLEALPKSQNSDGPARAGDGVTPIIITSNDLAAAWAIDQRGNPVLPIDSAMPRQREMALRGGVNIVIYVLTGNYKADQVHVPALLERLGQ